MTESSRKLRSIAATVCLFLTSVSVCLAVTELITRALARSGVRRATVAPSELEGLPVLRDVLDLAKPNQRGVYMGHFYRTNSAGLRGPEYERATPPGTFRIVVIGDSYTMGAGVAEAETYSALLERDLNVAGPGRYEVLNLGIAGLNVRHSLDRLRGVGLQFAPDLIVYGFTINDLEGLPGYRQTTPLNSAKPSPSVAWNLAQEGWRSLRDLVSPARGSYLYELNENFFNNPEVWRSFQANLSELSQIGRSEGDCVVVLIHPLLVQLHHYHPLRRHYEKVEQAATEQGMTAVQSFPLAIGRSPSDLTLSLVDPHPNPAGHRLLERALLAGLGGLPSSCWKGQRPNEVVFALR